MLPVCRTTPFSVSTTAPSNIPVYFSLDIGQVGKPNTIAASKIGHTDSFGGTILLLDARLEDITQGVLEEVVLQMEAC